MLRNLLLLILLFQIIFFIACSHKGYKGVYQLGYNLNKSLINNDISKVKKGIPNQKVMSQFLEDYFINSNKTSEVRKQNASHKADSIEVNLFSKINSTSLKVNKSVSKETSYKISFDETDTKYGYKEGRGVISYQLAPDKTFDVKFTTLKVKNSWYLLSVE